MPAFIIDTREPEHVQNLAFGGAPVSKTALDHGDIAVACDDATLILIERKTPEDLLGSIADGRIFNQVVGMLDTTRFAYVVITGGIRSNGAGKVVTDRGETGWAFASVQGALLSMQELGAMVCFCPSDADFEKTVLTIAARKHDSIKIKPARPAELLSPAASILCSLPGIGPERARGSLEHCGSGAWALATLTQPGETIPGVPPAATQNIRTALGLQAHEVLAVITQ